MGINPGLWSGAVGHHFARPGNRFWKALRGSGFTDRLLSPLEDASLLDVAPRRDEPRRPNHRDRRRAERRRDPRWGARARASGSRRCGRGSSPCSGSAPTARGSADPTRRSGRRRRSGRLAALGAAESERPERPLPARRPHRTVPSAPRGGGEVGDIPATVDIDFGIGRLPEIRSARDPGGQLPSARPRPTRPPPPSSSSRTAANHSSSMRSFGRPAARFMRIRSSIDATRTVSPSTTSSRRVRVQVGEPLRPRRHAEDVERAHRRAEREVIAGAQRSSIEQERHVRRGAAEVSVERAERVGQSLEVVVVPRVADVEIAGDHRRTSEGSGVPTDQDEPDVALEQRPQRRQRVERRLAHPRAARSNARVFSHSLTASRARSAVVSAEAFPDQGAVQARPGPQRPARRPCRRLAGGDPASPFSATPARARCARSPPEVPPIAGPAPAARARPRAEPRARSSGRPRLR